MALDDLNELISSELPEEETPTYRLWLRITIHPEKWVEHEYGIEGGGFWVVGLLGKNVLWFIAIKGDLMYLHFKNMERLTNMKLNSLSCAMY